MPVSFTPHTWQSDYFGLTEIILTCPRCYTATDVIVQIHEHLHQQQALGMSMIKQTSLWFYTISRYTNSGVIVISSRSCVMELLLRV